MHNWGITYHLPPVFLAQLSQAPIMYVPVLGRPRWHQEAWRRWAVGRQRCTAFASSSVSSYCGHSEAAVLGGVVEGGGIYRGVPYAGICPETYNLEDISTFDNSILENYMQHSKWHLPKTYYINTH